ncbi:tetratricopeptide repeat protein [Xanthobacteraceae bacterium Astr-EGSB]|uniref:tetratricopeptide repeat protein n=1 Tax=Astrobacterium formosum TaxID=3069710 RepID=UPI0027B535ED|nr:tetratricopeptide repeat protein [Xanthobacteraceae bacterium Astr-EGSB]
MIQRVMIFFNERVMLSALAHGDYAKAELALGHLQRWEGRTRRVMHNLAVVRMGQGRFAEAEALFEQQIEDYGDNPDLLRALAETAYLAGDRAHAARRIEAALAEPECPEPELLKRRAAICADPRAHAKSMEGKKNFAAALAHLGKGEKDAAIDAFRRAADADPSDFVALNNLGALLMNHAKDYAGAARVFEKALALSEQALMRDNLAKARDKAQQKAKGKA